MADYIKRALVLDAINDANDEGYFKGYNEYSSLFDEIDTMPRADVQEVKHGKWIDKTTWFHHIGHIKHECSVCGCIRYGERTDGKGMKYCEECGARMDLEE